MKRSALTRKTPLRTRTKIKSVSGKTVAKLKKELDSLCSKYVRLRDDYTCVVCGIRNPVWTMGDPTSASCGHIITRGAGSLRFDVRPDGNLHTQCSRCNSIHGGKNFRIRQNADQWPYVKWYIDKFGMDRWEQLREEGKQDGHWGKGDLEIRIEEMKIALKALEDK